MISRASGPSRTSGLFVGVVCAVLMRPIVVGASNGKPSLVDAVKAGNRDAIRLLARRGEVNRPEADGTTALHWSVQRNDREATLVLMSAGANVNAADRYGVTPLSLAATNGDALMLETLITAGANPNARLTDGETVLMTASRTGNPAAVKALLAGGADANASERSQGQTALMWAAARNNAEAARALAESRADLNVQSSALDYPLFKWTLNGMVSTALPRGGWTALMFAAREDALDAAKVLVEAGADLNRQDGEGSTALIVAIVNAHFDLALLLLDRGADPNVADETGMSALYAAVDMHTVAPMLSRPGLKLTSKLGAVELVERLLAHGANPNAPLKKPIIGRHHGAGDTDLGEGATPLMRAAKSHDLELMRALLNGGADATAVQRDYTNAAMLAAAGGARAVAYNVRPFQVTPATEEESITILVEHGVDVNAFNANGMTALHYAAERGADAMVRLLGARGALLDLPNKQGRTPLDLSLGGSGTGRRGRGTAPVFEGTAALLRQLMQMTGIAVEPQ